MIVIVLVVGLIIIAIQIGPTVYTGYKAYSKGKEVLTEFGKDSPDFVKLAKEGYTSFFV